VTDDRHTDQNTDKIKCAAALLFSFFRKLFQCAHFDVIIHFPATEASVTNIKIVLSSSKHKPKIHRNLLILNALIYTTLFVI